LAQAQAAQGQAGQVATNAYYNNPAAIQQYQQMYQA
jgi:hypothetical protein